MSAATTQEIWDNGKRERLLEAWRSKGSPRCPLCTGPLEDSLSGRHTLPPHEHPGQAGICYCENGE